MHSLLFSQGVHYVSQSRVASFLNSSASYNNYAAQRYDTHRMLSPNALSSNVDTFRSE